jgi:hypothetical protein
LSRSAMVSFVQRTSFFGRFNHFSVGAFSTRIVGNLGVFSMSIERNLL